MRKIIVTALLAGLASCEWQPVAAQVYIPDPGPVYPYPGPGTNMPTPRVPYGEGPQYAPPRVTPYPGYQPPPPGTNLYREYQQYRYDLGPRR